MLALIPLDNRPCNLRFPHQIANISDSELVTPPDELLGYFNTPGQPEEIIQWLEQLPPVDALIVSIDMLAYGGLVASRRPAIPAETALEYLQALRNFREARPETPIYAFNIVMRLAVTMDSEEAVANYYNLIRYGRLVDEAERFQSDYLREELQKVTAQIPAGVLKEYHNARARNHLVTCRMVDWLAEGIFEYLLITQEDATEFGLHRREQDRIMARVTMHDVANKMSLHPGADEAALTVLARHWNTGVRFRVHWSNLEDSHRIAPFEDRPYDESLLLHIEAVHGIIVEDDTADFELFVNAPIVELNKHENDAERANRTARLTTFVREMAEAIEAGRSVALCDVAVLNGADNLIMAELDKRKLLGKLAAYGGWNTAGNTTGCLLAQCAALKKAQAESERDTGSSLIPHPSSLPLNRQFLFERYVDDWFYQSQVRSRIEKAAREQNATPINMGDKYGVPEAQARRELRGFAQLLAQRHFHTTLQNCEVTLPWRRSFEVDVRATLADSSSD